MDIVDVAPGLHLLPLGISNAYLWHDESGTTLVDTGPPGSGAAIKAALEDLGLPPQELRRIVLTHFHDDHAGSAEDLAQWSGATVVVGRADAAFVRGDEPGPPAAFTPAEQQLHAVVAADLQPAPACRVDQEVSDQDVLQLGSGAVVLAVPGHTPGSIALHLPEAGLLLTGDTIADHKGGVVLGPFNTDRELAWRSLERLVALDVDVACFLADLAPQLGHHRLGELDTGHPHAAGSERDGDPAGTNRELECRTGPSQARKEVDGGAASPGRP